MKEPMLAVPMHKDKITDWNDWALEEKYDGHRLVVEVDGDGFVFAYTRPRTHAGFAGKTMAQRQLPFALREAIRKTFAFNTVLDGELRAGKTSTDVTRTDLEDQLHYVVFDVTRTRAGSCAMFTYDQRRAILEMFFRSHDPTLADKVRLSASYNLTAQADVQRHVKRIWNEGGEGAILKKRDSRYDFGKRSPNWIKVKKQQHATLTVIGFEVSKGTVRFPGRPFAIVRLRDQDGHETTVKTKDDHELQRLTDAAAHTEGTVDHIMKTHPWIGRGLVIEFQDRTRDGQYRHPMWDRWEDE